MLLQHFICRLIILTAQSWVIFLIYGFFEHIAYRLGEIAN
jgi:hypothetical protein